MDSDETPLLIGSNDQAAYAIIPSPQMRMMLIGDLKTQPLQGVDLISQKERYQAVKQLRRVEEFEEQKTVSKEGNVNHQRKYP